MNKKIDLKLNLLNDSPVLRRGSEYYDFYHKHVSPVIHQITTKEKGIHTIGLFGNWGSGKSTIIENLKADYSGSPIFVFDVWKYKGDPLRRTFLLKLYNFVETSQLWKKNKRIDESELSDLYESKSISEQISITGEITIVKKVFKFIFENLFIILLVLLFVSWLVLQLSLGENNPFVHSLLLLVGYAAQSTAFVIFFSWVAQEIVNNLVDRLFKSLDKDVKTQTIIRTRDYLNSPEQFEEKFADILSALDKKLIVVFDNIDRVQGDIAIEILSTIKTFIEPGLESNVAFIIPCDSNAIEEQIVKYYGDHVSKIDPSEYLRKLFNVVIWTPDFIQADLEDFTLKQMSLLGGGSDLIKDNDELLRVITAAFKSPREIKQFLNNLVASILVVSNTDVWEEVSKNIPYLAKVLVLKQKFPGAYSRLKEKWYDPENIVDNPDDAGNFELRNFMISTSNVHVTSAEPYIYFKQSNAEKQFSDSHNLLAALAGADFEKSKLLVTKNIKKIDLLIKFVLAIYDKYQSQVDLLTRIVSTFIAVVSEINVKLKGNLFFNRTAKVIERDIWQNYRKLDTDSVFKMFVNDNRVKKETRESLMDRYITAFGSPEVAGVKDDPFSISLINNFIKTQDISEVHISKIKNEVEAKYIQKLDIFRLFGDYDSQNRFISKNALEKYIQTITIDNFVNYLSPLINFKKHIGNLSSGNVLTNVLIALVGKDREKGVDHSGEKLALYETIRHLVTDPDSFLGNSDTNLLDSFEKEVIATFQSITDINNKGYVVHVLYEVSFYLNETHPETEEQADGLISQFIRSADQRVINDFLGLLSSERSTHFVNYYLDDFIDRGIRNGGDDLEVAYKLMAADDQQNVINSLINQRDDLGLPYIESMEKLPNRVETLTNILSRIHVSSSKLEAYKWVGNAIKRTDPQQIKDQAILEVKSLLKSDDALSQELGFNFMSSFKFLNKSQRTSIGDELAEWLRTPGKVIVFNHRYILKALSILSLSLSPFRREDFIYVLFDMLGRADDRSTNDVALEIMAEIKLSWKDNKDYYEQFKERVDKWGNNDDRNYILDNLLKNMRPLRVGKKEKVYWDFLESMKNLPSS